MKELQSNSIIQEIDNPGLLSAAQLIGQPSEFWEHDSLHKCDDYLAGVKNFVPSWPLCLDPSNANAIQRETPLGGHAPQKGAATRGDGECTIPYFQLQNTNTHTAVDVECKTGAAAGVNTFVQPYPAANDVAVGTVRVQVPAHNDTIAATAPFPDVRSQLYNIARGNYFKLFPCTDILNSCVKYSPSYDKYLIELNVAKYSDAIQDLAATFNNGGGWTRATNFTKFRIVDCKMHLFKLFLNSEAASQFAQVYESVGYSYPFSSFLRYQADFSRVQNLITFTFADRSVRSLDKLIIICRKTVNTGSDAKLNKYKLEMGCTNDSNPFDANRPYNGLSKISFKYNQESWIEPTTEFGPYQLDKIKSYTEGAFERQCGAPALFRHNYEGIGNHGGAADAGYTTENMKIFNACTVSDFIMAFDFRTLKNSQLSGLDITRSDLTCTIERASTVNADDLHFDCYYVVGSERRVAAAANSVLM